MIVASDRNYHENQESLVAELFALNNDFISLQGLPAGDAEITREEEQVPEERLREPLKEHPASASRESNLETLMANLRRSCERFNSGLLRD
jgi:hypothetical protein